MGLQAGKAQHDFHFNRSGQYCTSYCHPSSLLVQIRKRSFFNVLLTPQTAVNMQISMF